VNSLLIEPNILIDENFILLKSMYVCMIRFDDNTSIAHGGEGELQQDDQDGEHERGVGGSRAITREGRHAANKKLSPPIGIQNNSLSQNQFRFCSDRQKL
jgi:hypothetical protein